LATAAALVTLSAFVAWQVRVGADALWPVAMGRAVLDGGRLPQGVPFAAAGSAGWANVPVLGELVLTAVAAFGGRGLGAFQVLADVVALGALAAVALRRGAADSRAALALVLAVLAGAPALVIIRLQVLSLIPFALLLLLLHREHEAPSRRIWLLPALVVIWTNLHGAVLIGVAVAGCYLLLSRLRIDPVRTVAVGVLTLAAVLVTPAGTGTLGYYLGVLDNEAAARGEGLWAHPSLGSGLDVVMLLGLAGLLLLTLRRRQPLWVYAAALGLGVATASAVRNGVWLGMVLVLPATLAEGRAERTTHARREARAQRRPHPSRPPRAGRRIGRLAGLTGLGGIVTIVTVAVLLARPDAVDPTPPGLVPTVRSVAAGRPVLAPEPVVERLAAEGVRVWMSNPIDAFSRTDQGIYLDFLDGRPGGQVALDAVDVVVVESGTDPDRLVRADRRWHAAASVGDWTAYTR